MGYLGGDQHSEQRIIERPIFRNFEISNIKRTEDELFDLFNFEFIFYLFEYLLKYMIVYKIGNL